ncbi:DUF397 domain-containing protein [Streptomyces sp. NPDC050844]|uniref:DUF397 domain-containing protein n=1 Tax=Streptomyces sp. NPDC050844 TaxID=3155790 RepID=UPI0033E06479
MCRVAGAGCPGCRPWLHPTSYSSNEGPDCVEVAAAPGTVHVRDSKIKTGARLAFRSDSWSAFVAFTTKRN